MVRHYKRKKLPPSYTKEDLQNAVDSVKSRSLSLYRAAKVFKIPKSTLFKRVNGQRGLKSRTMGRPPALPHEIEQNIANSLVTLEKWGFGLSKKEVIEIMAAYIKQNNLKTPFKNGIPGNDYFIRFKKEFNLSQKKPQSVEVARKRSMDPFIITDYFKLLKKELANIPPAQIYNVDETSFCLDPSRVKVVGQKGTAAHRATSGPGRENISVLMGANAAGEKLPPQIIFKGSWIPDKEDEFPGMSYAATANGWMDAVTFQQNFTNTFLKHIGPERPVVLIYDGHSSHVGLSLVQTAKANDVVIIKLPPHSSHILQPMDLSVFKPLKLMWDEELIKWQRKNYGVKLPKRTFATILSKVWNNIEPTIIQNGFAKAGIYPFNHDVVPKEKFEPDAFRRWSLSHQNNLPLPGTAEDDTVDAPVASVSTAPDVEPLQNNSMPEKISFESLLLQQLKQSPRVQTGRRKICSGAEVITSSEALAKLKEIENKQQTKQLKIKKPKNKEVQQIQNNTQPIDQPEDEELDDEVEAAEPELSDDSMIDYNIEDEMREFVEENEFMTAVTKDVKQLEIGDWLIVKFCPRKVSKFYVAQITETNPSIEAKFARKIGTTNYFHWPDVEDRSIITLDEVHLHLPKPTFDKRGKFKFDISFTTYNIC